MAPDKDELRSAYETSLLPRRGDASEPVSPAEPAAPAKQDQPPPTSTGAALERAPVLAVRNLKKRYGRVHVLNDLSLTVLPGEVYGFLGRNGSGKTTTIRAIVGIHKADAGLIELLGERTERPSRRQKMRIGYVSQEQYFYPWMTCRRLGQFVRGFYPTWDDAEFERLLDVLDLPGPRKVSALSKGMQVKLALALALAHRPELLILDEPTAGLDPAARREFLEIVAHQAQKEGRSTLFSSHIVEEIERIADRVGILDRGRLAYEGRIDDLRREVRRVHLRQPVADPALVHVPGGEHVSTHSPAQDQAQDQAEDQAQDGAQQQDQNQDPGEDPGQDQDQDQAPPRPPGQPQVEAEGPQALPEGFTLLEQRRNENGVALVLRADPQVWASAPFAPGTVEMLTLEDIFLALAVGRVSLA